MSPQQRLDHPNRTILSHYRPDVDGLRAIAVLAVIGFHAFPDWVRGGFVGVDVFFVISGYLISTILFTSMDHNSFSFWRFYARRIRRIFPALLVVLLACLLLGWLVLFSNEYTHLAKHIAGGAAFVSNFVLWNEAGYFDTSAETKPLLHLWSLGIEEQFYILWPLLLYCTWKCTGGWFALLAVVLVGTFVFNIRTVVIDSTAAFYSPLARFWELMAGGMLAYFSLKGTDPHWVSAKRLATVFRAASTARSNNIKGIVGLVLLATALLMLDRTVQYPGWWALLPIVGTCMVLCAGSAAWINKKLLATRVLVVIGLISYPLYLWHWPLLSFARIVEGETPPPRTRALAVFASFLLASLTYLLVERPIRFGKISAAKTSMPLIILMGAVGCAGLYVYKEYGLPFRHKGLEDIVAAATDFDQENYASLTKYGEGIDELEQSILVIGKPGAATTALVGDSTMQQYIPRVRRLAERNAIDLDNNRVVFAIAGGLPVPDIWSDFDPVQAAAWTKILPALSGNAVKTVAIAAYWTAFFKFAGFYVRSIGPDKLLGELETATAQAFQNFSVLISQLVRAGKRVLVVLETPSSNAFDPNQLLPKGWARLSHKPTILDVRRSEMERFNGEISQKLRMVAEAAGARVISPMDYLCDENTCPAFTKDGMLMYYNWNHLRASFVRQSATWIDEIFQPISRSGAVTP